MKKNLFFTFLFILFLGTCFAEELNPAWVQKDADNLSKTLDFINKKIYSDSQILKFMNTNNSSSLQGKKLGFGLNQYCSQFNGGYFSVIFLYNQFNNLPCELKIMFHKDDFKRIESELNSDLVNQIRSKFSVDDDYFFYIIENSMNKKNYKAAKEKLVGKIIPVSIPKEYKTYYDSLNLSTYQEVYGSFVGIAAGIPSGRIAMKKLLELNNKDIFINLLKGDNPAGRMYGMEGLLCLENTQENVDLINKIFDILIKEGVIYSYGAGCLRSYLPYEKIEFSENFPPEDDDYLSYEEDKKTDFFLDLSFLDE